MTNYETQGEQIIVDPADIGEVLDQKVYENTSVHLTFSLRKGEYLVVTRVLTKQIARTMGNVVQFPELSPFSRTAEDDVLTSIATQNSGLKSTTRESERITDMKKSISILFPVMLFSLLLSGVSYYLLRNSIIMMDNTVDPFMLIVFIIMGLVWFFTAVAGFVKILKKL